MRLSGFPFGILLIFLQFTNAVSHKLHQTRNQAPKKCDLVCPGAAPIPLPSSLLQNCTGSGTNPESTTTSSTTKRPSTSSTTESSEEEESSEQNEEGEGRIAKRQKKERSKSTHQHLRRRSHQQRMRKHTLILKPETKSQLFKNHKNLKEKSQLDGCYVLCDGAPSSLPPGGPPSETGGDSGEDSADDNYVEGEDTPIEIVYVPPNENSNKRPSETYEINNYLVDPVPAFGFGFDPLFMEGKHKNVMKRKSHRIRKITDHNKPIKSHK
ncbi:uncharacterized protein LOC126750678 [Anthonomus grandis grandis]|uniref:uncharacterized protein LOC126750678 n=1 Tax=Anthonomus grandis grandis TaxID=2921223 RepID=UPI0021652865|nr:uncharacterized protein LOC126750678 [Anthonomus grandis grandis]